MYICNYCNRTLKQEYETCPGCGGSSFKNKAYLGEVIIKTPPKDGYKLNTDNYDKSLKSANRTIVIGILLFIFPFVFTLPALAFGVVEVLFLAPLGPFIGIILFIIGIIKRKKVKKSIDRINKLATTGMLVKAMPYKLINTGTMVLGKYYKCIQVVFKNSAGIEIPLYSETKHDAEMKDNETVDLLIDPDDYSNYFIDYEIF